MQKNKRAYSLITVKAINEDKREITGIASTPSTDRMGDIVEPKGAVFKLPIPLLWQHDHDEPIGNVTEARVTDEGIEIKATLVQVDQPSQLAARLEEAWQSIKSGLVRGLSIGFRPIEYNFIDDNGIRFTSWEWFELSAVTIPANADCSIQTIKSLDEKCLAALGNKNTIQKAVNKQTAGDSAKPKSKIVKLSSGDDNTMNIQEQIKSCEAKRAADAARLEELINKSAEEGRTLDEEESQLYEDLKAEIKSVDTHLSRLKESESILIAKAKPIIPEEVNKFSAVDARDNKAPAYVKTLKNEEPGVGFAKFAMAMYAAKGDTYGAKSFVEHNFPNDTRLQNVMKAAVAAGTTTNPTWAGNLVDYQNLTSEFIEYLRPRTIVGQFGVGSIPALRRVPFNVRIPGKTASGTAGWTGEGAYKPVTSSGYEAAELKWSKIAAISVITEELARFSDPSIQLMVRDDLAEAVIERMDVDFINPSKAAGTGTSLSPASVTNGVTAIPSTGDPEADINALWAVADEINLPTGSAVYITNTKTARSLSGMKNALGNKIYPDLTVTGGFIDGVPVIVSNYVPSDANGTLLILAFASEIYLADDGVVTVDISREATIFMDDDPNNTTPTAAQLINMFQTNQLAIRAERYVHWKKRRPQAVAYVSGVNYGANQTT